MTEKIELKKSYELNFKYQFNNMVRFDKSLIPDLLKIQSFLLENPNSVALISIKANYKGNEEMNKRIIDEQKQNVIKELEKLNINYDNIKILSLGNKFFKQGYNFPSNLDVYFFKNTDIDHYEENKLIEFYLKDFK
ncbi:MAG: hypothetical protein ACK5MD_01790 [Flavobacteriales bacterium]